MGFYIWIDAQAHPGIHAHPAGYSVYDFQLFRRLAVEALYAKLESCLDLMIALAYTSKDGCGGRKTAAYCMLNFISAHAVGPETELCYGFHDYGVEVGFHGIVHLKASFGCLLRCDGEGFAQHIRIIIIKGCAVSLQSPDNFFCKCHASGNSFKLSDRSATVLSLVFMSIDTLFRCLRRISFSPG